MIEKFPPLSTNAKWREEWERQDAERRKKRDHKEQIAIVRFNIRLQKLLNKVGCDHILPYFSDMEMSKEDVDKVLP